MLTKGGRPSITFGPQANQFTGGIRLGDGTSDGTAGIVIFNNNNSLGGNSNLVISQGDNLRAGTTGINLPNSISVRGGGLRTGGANDFE